MADKKPIPVESTKHKDKRVNIPTEELRNFVREDELTPKTMLYPRDPSLDPQALIENLRDTAKAGEAEPELTLFADDFNGIKDFEGVEPDVWEFQIGGYQVLDKWLKDRKGRKLTWEASSTTRR